LKEALYLLVCQGLLGAFDTIWYHEYQQVLPQTKAAKTELRLHAARDFAYALVFGSLAWVQWHGMWAWLFASVLLFEIGITLWDFVEEDQIRRLPAGERMMHTVMGIVYGAFLAFLIPQVFSWGNRPTEFYLVNYGWLSWLLSLFALGVLLSGIRDTVASFRLVQKDIPCAPPPSSPSPPRST
jgi:uncharacterized protein